jgi:DNA-binding SARP family transcriptional activator
MHGFALRRNGRPVSLQFSAQRLTAFLALRERPTHRSFVAGSLWTDSGEERASAALRTALWRATQCGCPLVSADGPNLSLADDVSVDVRDAMRSARALLSSPADADADAEARAPEQLIDAGDILPDWYDDWLLLERERFRQLRLQALETLGERLLTEGRHAEAANVALAAIAGEPLRESSHRLVVRIHLAQGNVYEAVRQYRFFRDLLRRKLDLAPSPAMDALFGGRAGRLGGWPATRA